MKAERNDGRGCDETGVVRWQQPLEAGSTLTVTLGATGVRMRCRDRAACARLGYPPLGGGVRVLARTRHFLPWLPEHGTYPKLGNAELRVEPQLLSLELPDYE